VSTDSDNREPDSPERIVPMRLQKFLARAGASSRRGAEDLMTAGRVAINGVTATELGTKVDPAVDVVTVDGAVVNLDAGPIYLVLNKPSGFVTTMDDPQGRPTVRDLIPPIPGLFPVGRLDRDTTGLLLFTTDGDLSHRLLHPRYHVSKTYRVIADGSVTEAELDRLRSGITLDDGPCRPAQVKLLAATPERSTVEISISEGRKRQVKRMFGAISHPVLELERTSFGPLLLGGLARGETRELGQAEVDALNRAAGAAERPAHVKGES